MVLVGVPGYNISNQNSSTSTNVLLYEFSVSRTAWRNKSHSIFSIYKVKVAQEILCMHYGASDQKHL